MAITINGSGTITGVSAQDELNVDSNTLVVDSTNNRVGIGTTSPDKKLEIVTPSSDTAAIKIIDSTDATASYIGQFSDVTYISNNTTYSSGWSADDTAVGISSMNLESGRIILSTDSAGNSTPQGRMRIDSNGDLYFGETFTSAPWNATSGSGGYYYNADGMLCLMSTDNQALLLNRTNSTGTIIKFYKGGTIVGTIDVGTSSTSYNTSSDYRLKENVVDMDGAIDRVKALQPKRFNFIADEDDTTVDGFLAHEVSSTVPEAVTGEKDATKEEEYEVTPAVLDDDGNVVTEAVMGTRTVPDYQGIDQSKLVPLLTGALQEAITKIEALETRIEALENA